MYEETNYHSTCFCDYISRGSISSLLCSVTFIQFHCMLLVPDVHVYTPLLSDRGIKIGI